MRSKEAKLLHKNYDLNQRNIALMKIVKNKDNEIANLKACIRDARYLNEGVKILIEQVDALLMTHKPMERTKK